MDKNGLAARSVHIPKKVRAKVYLYNLSAITSSFRYKAFSLNSLDKAYCCKTSYVELVRTIFFDGDC